MAIQTITYDDKIYINQNEDIPNINKVKDDDMNEIKSVVNNNANELNNLMPTILYDNSDGSSSDITLNDNITNYKYYEIIFARNGYGYQSLKMPTDYLTNVSLITSFFSGNILRYYMANIDISGTNITRNYAKSLNFTEQNAFNFGDETAFYIYKVIGYK